MSAIGNHLFAMSARLKAKAFRREELLLFILIFFSYAYFYSNGGWNQSSRFDAIFAFVENTSPDCGSFRIDRFIIDPARNLNTGDWASYHGHYYSNKAPGTIFLGIAVYAPLYYAERLLVGINLPPRLEIFNAYLINLFVSVFWMALATVFFRRLLLKMNIAPLKATFFAVVFGLGTPLFPYSTQFWGHPTAAAFIVFSLYHLAEERPADKIASGLYLGLAVLCEYLSIVVVAVFALHLLWRDRRSLVLFIAGGLFPLLLFLGYHQLCFGSPFHPATLQSNPLFLEKDKMGGVFGAMSPLIVGQLLIGLKRGLLIGSPVLVFAFPGFIAAIRQSGLSRRIAGVSVAVVTLLLLVNAGFNGWHGGESISPRYLIIALPFLVAAAAQWQYRRSRQKIVLVALTAWSCANMLVIAALTPMCPQNTANPLYGDWYPRFFNGNFTTGIYPLRLHFTLPEWPALLPWTSFNLGRLAGLEGLPSLLPWLFFIGFMCLLLLRAQLRAQRGSQALPGSDR